MKVCKYCLYCILHYKNKDSKMYGELFCDKKGCVVMDYDSCNEFLSAIEAIKTLRYKIPRDNYPIETGGWRR